MDGAEGEEEEENYQIRELLHQKLWSTLRNVNCEIKEKKKLKKKKKVCAEKHYCKSQSAIGLSIGWKKLVNFQRITNNNEKIKFQNCKCDKNILDLNKWCVSEHFGVFQSISEAFQWCLVLFPFCCTTCFGFAAPTFTLKRHRVTPKWYMKLVFTKNIEQNTIKSCLKFKIVHCLYYKPLFTRQKYNWKKLES